MREPKGQSWQSLVFGLVALAIGLQLVAAVLPRVLPSLVLIAVIVVALRFVWFFTGRF